MIPLAIPALTGALPALRWAWRVVRVGWPILALIAVFIFCWYFFVKPLEDTITTLKDDLSAERAAHLDTREVLSAEISARAEANLRAAEIAAANVALSRRLDEAEAARAQARREALNAANQEIENATPSWRDYRFDPVDGWRVCVNAARITGIHHPDCGDPPADVGGPGGPL